MKGLFMTLYSQASCHGCDWETEREENDSVRTRRLIRKHHAQNPAHDIYMEQGRLVAYRGKEGP